MMNSCHHFRMEVMNDPNIPSLPPYESDDMSSSSISTDHDLEGMTGYIDVVAFFTRLHGDRWKTHKMPPFINNFRYILMIAEDLECAGHIGHARALLRHTRMACEREANMTVQTLKPLGCIVSQYAVSQLIKDLADKMDKKPKHYNWIQKLYNPRSKTQNYRLKEKVWNYKQTHEQKLARTVRFAVPY